MTVEIKELVIRAIIKPEAGTHPGEADNPREQLDEQAIVEACVKQVLKILKRKQGR